MPSHFAAGSQERSGALEAMFNSVKKKLRDGPGPNSYKDTDILDEYYNGGDGEMGSLGDSLGRGSLGRPLSGEGSLGGGLGSLGGGLGAMSENYESDLFGGKHDAGSSSIFGMDDVGLSSSFKETMTINESAHGEPAILTPFAQQASAPAASAAAVAKARKPAATASSAAAALAGSKDMGPPQSRAAAPSVSKPASSAAAVMAGTTTAAAALASMPAPMSAVGILDENNERLSHKEVEQRRREKAKQYFDELRSLLPCGAESKFDKNTILQNTIAMIKQLQAELHFHKETRELSQGKQVARPAAQPASHDYAHSFEMVRQPLCFCGLDGIVWETNQAFVHLLGYGNKSEVVGLSLLNKTASTDNEASSQHWQRLISSGMCNAAFYCQLIRKDNQTLTVNMDLNLVHKRNNPFCFLVATNPAT